MDILSDLALMLTALSFILAILAIVFSRAPKPPAD